MNASRNARFWIRWNNTWIKLTIRFGQTLTLSGGGSTDEGWSYTRRTYTHTGDTVFYVINTESQDCDGRHGDYSELTCPLADLKANDDQDDADEARPPLPCWDRVSNRCRDQFAESAGY